MMRLWGFDGRARDWVVSGAAWETGYRLLFEAGAEGMLVVDGGGDVVDANPAACRILRRRREDETTLGEVFDGSDPRLGPALEAGRRAGRFRGELRMLRRDGTPFSAEARILANWDGFLCVVFRDVTGSVEAGEEAKRFDEELEKRVGERAARLEAAVAELKENERQLRESEERYRGIFENAVEGIFRTTVGGDLVAANPAMASMLGYESPEEMLECVSNVAEQLYVKPGRRTEFAEIMGRRGAVSGFEVELYRRDGGTAWGSVSARVLRDAVGDIIGYEGTLEDITERKKMEKELRESEERFRATFDQAPVGVAHVALDGRWLRANKKLCETLGFARDELQRKTLQGVTHSDHLEHGEDLLSGEFEEYAEERVCIKKDHSQVWVRLTATPVRGAAGKPEYFILLVEDVTGRKEAGRVLRSMTPREVEVLGFLARGYKNREIAEALNFSLGTAKSDVQEVISILGASNRTQAVARAIELGIVPG